MNDFTVIKRDHRGETVLTYTGEVISRSETAVCLRARFASEDVKLPYVTLKTGDLFTEWFYTDRYYNIFQIEAMPSGRLKGWYCNITRPAVLLENSVAADDLALDLFVQPDGTMLLLDEDEFRALPLSETERDRCWQAVAELRQRVLQRASPFDCIGA